MKRNQLGGESKLSDDQKSVVGWNCGKREIEKEKQKEWEHKQIN